MAEVYRLASLVSGIRNGIALLRLRVLRFPWCVSEPNSISLRFCTLLRSSYLHDKGTTTQNMWQEYWGEKCIPNFAFLTTTPTWMSQQTLHSLTLDVCSSSKLWSYHTAVSVTNYEQHYPLIWLTSLFLTTSTEINLRDRVTHMPPPRPNKAAHSGFETQRTRHQKTKTGVSVAPKKGLMSSNFF